MVSACGGGGGGGNKETVAGNKPPPTIGADEQAPTLVITDPGDFQAITVSERSIDLFGIARDNREVRSVRWSTNFGTSGEASGTTRWAAKGIPVAEEKTTVTLIAEDTDGNQASRFLQITHDPGAVDVNTPPVLSGSPPKTAMAGEPWRFRPTASDADGDTLEFAARNLPDWLSLDSRTGQLQGTPSSNDAGEVTGIALSVSDGIAVTELAPFSITVSEPEKSGEAWVPTLPADALVIVEVENHQTPVTLPRGDVRSDSGGVVGSARHTQNGRDQVLLHSWPLQILLAASGQLAVADLQRDTRYVHPSELDGGEPTAFAVQCEADRWTVNVGGTELAVPSSKAPPVCIAATWGKVTIGAANGQGTAAVAGPFDLVWYGREGAAGRDGTPEPGPDPEPVPDPAPAPDPEPEPGPEPEPEPQPEPDPGERTVYLSVTDIVAPETVRRESTWEAPQGAGGIQVTYTPGEAASTATFIDSWPLSVRFVAEGEVIVTWAKSGQFTELRTPAAATVGKPMNIHWRCGVDGWRLEVDGNAGVREGQGMPCVDAPWGNPIHVGNDRTGNTAIAGRLSLNWYADGSPDPEPEPEPVEPPPGDPEEPPPGDPEEPPPSDPVVPPEPKPAEVAFVGDFETGDLSQWPSVGALDKHAYAVNARTDRAAGGRFAGRMEVRYLDRGFNEDGTPKKVRAEIFEKPVPNGTEWWYGWSSMIAPEWQDQTNTWYIIQQFHQNNLGSPPLFQRYAGGKWSIHCLKTICGGKGVLWEERIPKDQWVDFIYQIKWSAGDDGLLRIWKDGKLIVDYRGPNNYDSRNAPYFKFGVYRGGNDEETQVIWHDEYRRGTAKNAVNPESYR
jgi:hypothetical protein